MSIVVIESSIGRSNETRPRVGSNYRRKGWQRRFLAIADVFYPLRYVLLA